MFQVEKIQEAIRTKEKFYHCMIQSGSGTREGKREYRYYLRNKYLCTIINYPLDFPDKVDIQLVDNGMKKRVKLSHLISIAEAALYPEGRIWVGEVPQMNSKSLVRT